MLLERHISNIEESKFPTINELIMPFYEPYEHVLCPTPSRLRLYTPTQLALAPEPFYSSVSGPWEHGGRYPLLTDKKSLFCLF